MLVHLIGSKMDISIFDANYNNDKTGAKAIPPKVLIKLILYGYSKGIKSSRGLECLSKNNVIAKALTDDYGSALDNNSKFYIRKQRKVSTDICKSINILS